MCDMDSGETCSVWNEREIKARKAHRCASCHALVRPGEKYLRHFSVFDGEATDEASCLDCNADRRAFGSAEGHFIPSPGYFVEALQSCISDGDDESDTKWRPMLDRIEARSPRVVLS